jgi:hypothetical protein
MPEATLEFLAEVAVYAWPWGEKRCWKLSVVLAVAIVAAVVWVLLTGD